MLHYILQIVAFQLVFLLVYDLFLKRETFFNYNRLYLLGTSVLSLVLPFIKLESVKSVGPKDFIIRLPEVIIGELSPVSTDLQTEVALQAGIVLEQPSLPIWQTIMYSGMCLATLLFIIKITKLYWLKYRNPKEVRGNILIVKLLKSSAAFSFFRTIFMGELISKSEEPTILKHELVHVHQKHTIDLLYFEALRILMWFNPLVYMYQNRIKTLHEYIADAQAIKNNGKKDYYQSLLNQVFESKNLSFTNTFFKQSLIKKRIVMLQKSKSKQVALIKYAMLIPLVFTMLIYTSAEVRAQEKEAETIVETFEVQEVSEETLKKRILHTIETMQKNGASFFEIAEYAANYKQHKKYILSKEDYLKTIVYTEYILQKGIERKSEDGTLGQNDIDITNQITSKHKTYDDYLKWKKTDEAKEHWELSTQDGVLKLVVDDLKNLSSKEQKRLDNLIKQLENDDFFSEIVVCEGYSSMIIHASDSRKEIKEEIQLTEIQEHIEVPFSIIEVVPTFPECKDLLSNEEKKKCTSKTISSFVNKNFNTDLASQLGLSGRMRVSVGFKIGKDGNINSIFARAPHPELEVEAKRVVGLLPQFIAGAHRGKAVTVPYALPIIFQVQEDNVSPTPNATAVEEIEITEIQESIEVPFAVIDQVPTLTECKDLASNDAKKKCTSDTVAKFVVKNFNTDLATQLGLSGRMRIAVSFKIGKDGYINSIIARAPHPELKAEAERVIGLLPQFIPGKHRGKVVTVPYALPILFTVNSDSDIKKTPVNTEFIQDLKNKENNAIAFSEVEKAPTFQNCTNLVLKANEDANEAIKACTSKTISSFVNRNFNTDLALDLDLKGRQRIVVFFTFGKDGKFKNFDIKAPHPKLAEEAERVIKMLPKFSKGRHKGKAVDVSSSLPILFQVQ